MTEPSHRTIRIAVALAISLFTVCEASAVRADELPPFGRRGQFVLDDVIGFRFGEPGYLGQLRSASAADITHGTPPPTAGQGGIFGYEHDENGAFMTVAPGRIEQDHLTTNAVWFAPAGDYFFTNRISIGASLGILYSNTEVTGRSVIPGYRAYTLLLSIAPRVGYVIPITDRIALWPRLAVGNTAATGQQYFGKLGGWGGDKPLTTWFGGADLGIVFRVTKHLMLHLTPALVASATTANVNGTQHDFAIGAAGAASIAIAL